MREFNPPYAEAEGALPGSNREFVEHLRNRGKFFDHEEKRERDLILKRKRRVREFPDTAFRPRVPSPERLNHIERRERKEDLDSESLSSLCSLRFVIHQTSGRAAPELSFRTRGGHARFQS